MLLVTDYTIGGVTTVFQPQTQSVIKPNFWLFEFIGREIILPLRENDLPVR